VYIFHFLLSTFRYKLVSVQLTVHSEKTRTVQEVRAMAIAVQANLVTLVVAESKRQGKKPNQHEIKTAPPGAVKHFRETLIDPKSIADYSDVELHLRLREIWGQFCLMGWLFSLNDPSRVGPAHHSSPKESDNPVTFASLPDNAEMHCGTALEIKDAEIRGFLWKMLFEQRRRLDPAYEKSPAFAKEMELASQIPANGFGKPIEKLTGEQLLYLSCEYAGMLAAIRWTMNPKLTWAAPGIMEVGESPFDDVSDSGAEVNRPKG
jgi:hypothetical protein